jgi:hypothetical protein
MQFFLVNFGITRMNVHIPAVIEADTRTRANSLTISNKDAIRETELRPAPIRELARPDRFVERLKTTVIPLAFLSLAVITSLVWSAFLLWMLLRVVN